MYPSFTMITQSPLLSSPLFNLPPLGYSVFSFHHSLSPPPLYLLSFSTFVISASHLQPSRFLFTKASKFLPTSKPPPIDLHIFLFNSFVRSFSVPHLATSIHPHVNQQSITFFPLGHLHVCMYVLTNPLPSPSTRHPTLYSSTDTSIYILLLSCCGVMIQRPLLSTKLHQNI